MPEPVTIALLVGGIGAVAGFLGRMVRKHAQREANGAGQKLARACHLARQMEERAGHRSRHLLAERSAALSWLYDRAQLACQRARVAPPGGLGPLGKTWSEAARWKEMIAGLHGQVSGRGPIDKWLNILIAGSLVAKALRSHLPLPDVARLPADAQAAGQAATGGAADWLDLSSAGDMADGAAFAASLGAGSLQDLMPDLPAGMAADLAADWAADLPLEAMGQMLDFAGSAFAPLALLRVGRYLYQADELRAQVPKLHRSAQEAAAHTRTMAKLCTSLRQREQAEEEAAFAVYKASMQLEALVADAGATPPAGLAAAAARLHSATQAWWRLATQQAAPGAGPASTALAT